MKKEQVKKVVTKAKWVLYSGVALNTVLLVAAVADWPKIPRSLGE